MLILLDDPSPLVRRALADVLAASPSAPPAVMLALAADQPQIAAPVLALSPLFVDADLVDAVATGNEDVQIAIASRSGLQRPVSAALAEVGTAEACLVLSQNSEAEIAEFSLDRILERFGERPAIREALLARDDLAAGLPASPRRWSILSPRADGSMPSAPNASRARLARRRR